MMLFIYTSILFKNLARKLIHSKVALRSCAVLNFSTMKETEFLNNNHDIALETEFLNDNHDITLARYLDFSEPNPRTST